MPVLVEGNSNV